MTKTLEEIKGMNIPVGAPIEIKTNAENKILGYFQSLENSDYEGGMIHYKGNTDDEDSKRFIPDIKDIKILEYKK